jgi:epoxyqueuosine reductase QueG
MGFPMEMYQTPGHGIWVVSHKPVAVEAGLGHMGIHRNLIHPKYGNFVLLGTVLIGCEASAYDHPIDYNPCLECKLCVAAYPVGAIGLDGSFNFSSCFTRDRETRSYGERHCVSRGVRQRGLSGFRHERTGAGRCDDPRCG